MDQGAVSAASTGQVAFDLLSNPFVLLRLPLSASKQDVAEAFDEALADGHAPDELLRDARRQLLAPKLRLMAAVGALPDASEEQRTAAISALQTGVPFSELLALGKELPAASRVTFLSNLAQLRPSSGILRYFVLTSAAVNMESLGDAIGLIFDDADLPRPSLEALEEAFDANAQLNARRLFSAYRETNAAANNMRQCLEEGLATASADQVAAYTSVVSAYLDYASSPLGDLRRRVESAIEGARSDAKSETAIDDLGASLLAWDEIAQPAHLLAQHKGRDEQDARDLFQKLRGFMIELANENEAARASLRLNKICLQVFAELPRAVAQLQEDQSDLQDLVDQEGTKELLLFVQKLRLNLDPLVADLNGGFELTGSGQARRLYALFDQAVRATKGTAAADIPWVLIRSLALDINNDLGEGAASEALIRGLVSHGQFSLASEQLRAAIKTDRQVLRTNSAQAKFKKAIDKKDTTTARQALVELADLATDDSERRDYQKAISNIDDAKRNRIIKWVFWAIVLAVIIISSASQGGGRSSSGSSASTYRPASTPAATPAAKPTVTAPVGRAPEKPALYSTGEFSRGQIRYCQFENALIDALDALIVSESNQVISLFNDKVDDYNLRCANYQYYQSDMTAVQQELNVAKLRISADARTMLQNWRASN